MVRWNSVLHELLRGIPLVDMILKIIVSWTRADRNLHMEVFNQRIIIEEI